MRRIFSFYVLHREVDDLVLEMGRWQLRWSIMGLFVDGRSDLELFKDISVYVCV